MKYTIPNLKKILIPRWAHKPGYGVNAKGFHKQDIWRQGTIPEDKKLLQKLGIKKGDKVLAIASYYGDWAKELKKAGAKVDYSDVSKSMVNYVKKQKDRKFNRYIHSGYESIPKKPLEYDWTFTYEACGGGQGLPIAYLRSLLNNKGGILVLHYNLKNPEAMGGKLDRYKMIVKNLAKAYGSKASVIRKKIVAKGKTDKLTLNKIYIIHKITTNNPARKKAEIDIKVLWDTKNKRVIDKKYEDSIKRLSILAKANGDKVVRKVEVR
ncbi:MAG: hypothetical protein ACE5ES_04230 [Candidatus Nanoarchaeia archaeon]